MFTNWADQSYHEQAPISTITLFVNNDVVFTTLFHLYIKQN